MPKVSKKNSKEKYFMKENEKYFAIVWECYILEFKSLKLIYYSIEMC
jgi:hypothetical protein